MSEKSLTRREFIATSALATTAAAATTLLPAPVMGSPKSKVVDSYSGKRGVTLYLELAQAPFPHKGSRHKDSTVVVFVPHHYRVLGGHVDTVLHFHGHNTTAVKAMKHHQLREQFYESRQNAILVMPQGPVHSRSSDGGKLDEDRGLLRFLTDLRQTLQTRDARRALGRAHIGGRSRIGRLCVSAHSGGYRVVSRCLQHGAYNINEVYLFDSLYGDVPHYRDWIEDRKKRDDRDKRHKLISYYGFGKVAQHNKRLMNELERLDIPYVHERKEGTLSRADITRARAVFIKTRTGHGDVTHEFFQLRDCLYASCLKRRLSSNWFKNAEKSRKLERYDPE